MGVDPGPEKNVSAQGVKWPVKMGSGGDLEGASGKPCDSGIAEECSHPALMVLNASRNSCKDRQEGHFTSEGISIDLGRCNFGGAQLQWFRMAEGRGAMN